MTQANGFTTQDYDLPIVGAATVPWRYQSSADHIAWVLSNTGMILQTLTPGVDFSISPTGDTLENVGVLTLLAAMPNGAMTLRLLRATPATQDYVPTPGAEAIAVQLDKIVLGLQEQNAALRRTLRSSVIDLEMIDPVSRGLLGWSSDASRIVNYDTAELMANLGTALGAMTSQVYPTLADAINDEALPVGATVGTLGYFDTGDVGAALYDTMTLAEFGGTPNGMSDHMMANGLVLKLQKARNQIIAEQYGIRHNTECSANWQEAFYAATELPGNAEAIVIFSCQTPILTKNTLNMSNRAGNRASWLLVDQIGTLKATTGGALAGSVFATSLPMIKLSVAKSRVNFGMVDCNRLCSGVLVRRASATTVFKPNIVRFQRYGYFACDGIVGQVAEGGNGNHVLMYANIKQWEQTDPEFDDPTDTQWTGDALVCGHKDWYVVGGTYGWSRAAMVLLDQSVNLGADAGNVEGRNIYCGYKSGGCGDFYARGAHLMQGRPPDDGGISKPRYDNRDIGGPINLECWNQTNKAYLIDTDWDSGTGQLYGHRVTIEGVSMVAGGRNRANDRVVLFDPVVRIYARADAVNPAGFELGQNNNLTIGFFPFEGNVWTGNYTQLNYDNRQRSPGYTGPVEYIGEWDAAVETDFPSGSVAGDFWLVRATPDVGNTVRGQLFMDGDLLYALVTAASTTVYAANWFDSANGQVDMLLRGVQGRASSGERHMMITTASVPMRSYYAVNNALITEYYLGANRAFQNWDGTTWQYSANAIKMKQWEFTPSGDLVATMLDQRIGYSVGTNAVQATSRTTAVTSNSSAGRITLFPAAGSAVRTTFRFNNSQIGLYDTIELTQKDGVNLYDTHVRKLTAAGACDISFVALDGGVAVDQPSFDFTITRGAISA